MWKIHFLDYKKPLVLCSFHKMKTEKTHTFAILFNAANIVTRHDFKSRDFSRTLQLPCQNGLHIGSNCISKDGMRQFTEGACYTASKEIASEMKYQDSH